MDSPIAGQHNRPTTAARESERIAVDLPARLTWKDQRGTTRFASVVARNVSEFGVYASAGRRFRCRSIVWCSSTRA
jgi:hypothetical protein